MTKRTRSSADGRRSLATQAAADVDRPLVAAQDPLRQGSGPNTYRATRTRRRRDDRGLRRARCWISQLRRHGPRGARCRGRAANTWRRCDLKVATVRPASDRYNVTSTPSCGRVPGWRAARRGQHAGRAGIYPRAAGPAAQGPRAQPPPGLQLFHHRPGRGWAPTAPRRDGSTASVDFAALQALMGQAGFEYVRCRQGDAIDPLQDVFKWEPDGPDAFLAASPRWVALPPKKVLVLSYYNDPNFGDRLGYHVINAQRIGAGEEVPSSPTPRSRPPGRFPTSPSTLAPDSGHRSANLNAATGVASRIA